MARAQALTGAERAGEPAPRARKDRGAGRSEAILDAAFRLFSDQGYTAVSIKDIAEASGVNSALIYYYFTNKEQLFLEVLKYSARSAIAGRQASNSSQNPVADLNLWFDANLTLAKPLGQLLRLMLDYRASRKRSAAIERLIKDFYRAELLLLKRAIGDGIKQGLFRPMDAADAALFVSSHLDGLIVAAVIRPGYDLAAGLRQLRKVLFAYLGYEKGARRRRQDGASSKLRVVV